MDDIRVFWEGIGSGGYLLVALSLLVLAYACYVTYRAVVVSRGLDLSPLPEHGGGVSVIITAHNRASDLRENLVGFLTQDCEDYEVIVVDDCSEDDTTEVLSALQEEYPRLRCTRIYPGAKFRFTKKLAINIGVLSARHEILLFSEADCYPASSSWARGMLSRFGEETAVVIGFSNYRADGRPFAWRRLLRLSRFLDRLLVAARGGRPTGDGCNMAYRKSCYMRNRGFAGDTQSYLGYDNDMVRELSKYGKVRVTGHRETHVLVGNGERANDIPYHFAAKATLPLATRAREELWNGIRLLIYALSIYLIASRVAPWSLLALVLAVYMAEVISVNLFAGRLLQRKLFLTSLIINVVGFAYRWYWCGYSIFNSKKWK
ncbi:MAG: glycosyltransferase [Odoribacteraceae bacterium]|nr:glycosyltransferase [Odoribacteraceae bacterium]